MPWFNDPDLYFDSSITTESISQGDIVVAPTTILMPGTSESDMAGPIEFGVRTVTLWTAASNEMPAAPSLSARVTWSLAMVVPHPCAMEKEWNEEITRRVTAGEAADTAKRAANDMAQKSELDPFVTLAPLRSYEELHPSIRKTVREGNRLGHFPVCARGTELPESFVDFTQLATVHETLVRTPTRFAALSAKARGRLQLSLSQFFAWRAKSLQGEIEASIGKRIDGITCVAKAGKLIATILLEDGATIVLEGNARSGPALPDLERDPR